MASATGGITFHIMDETGSGTHRRRPPPRQHVEIDMESNRSLEEGAHVTPIPFSFNDQASASRPAVISDRRSAINESAATTAIQLPNHPPVTSNPPAPPHRREIEARRYSGKESVKDYLLQFELTARRNGWTDVDKAWALLCALDGPARGILAEFDDAATAPYNDIKQSLERRFGPTDQTDVHEQALNQLRMTNGQHIREIAQEVQKLVRLAYPYIDCTTRERFAVKYIIQAIGDKDTIFYIKEKDPKSSQAVCDLYERHQALTSDSRKPASVRGVRPHFNDDGAEQPNGANETQHLAAQLKQLAERTDQQFQQLTEALSRLNTNSQQNQYTQPPSFSPGPGIQYGSYNDAQAASTVPRKPCPQCNVVGHWKRHCPLNQHQSKGQTGGCFGCGELGHRWRDCPQQGNARGPASAPNSRSAETIATRRQN